MMMSFDSHLAVARMSKPENDFHCRVKLRGSIIQGILGISYIQDAY